jgi:hypothetical protein
MRIAAIDAVSTAAPFEHLPVRLEQSASRTSAFVQLLLILPVAAVLLVPFGLVAALATEQPEALSFIVDRPLTAIQLGLGLALVAAIAAIPVRRAASKLGRSQTITIDDGLVTVTTKGLVGTASWSAPISSFLGLAHHIRATVSGARHEIVLVHPARDRSLLLEMSNRISKERIEALCAVLGLAELPARALYESASEPPASSLLQPAHA